MGNPAYLGTRPKDRVASFVYQHRPVAYVRGIGIFGRKQQADAPR